MRFKHHKTSVLLISISLLILITPNALASNYDRSYSAQVQFGLVNNTLHVSVPSSLYDYYNGKTIKLTNDNAYSTLVTPDAVNPIAQTLRNLTNNNPRNDEQFANTVLTLIHQIPYADGNVKYPIQTIVENTGKCDTLSLLAASIMKAGGLDIVLLYFKGVHHINVGVHLPYEPHGTWWWLPPTGYQSNNKTYWIAECTPAMNWKVGDVPPLLKDEAAWIIPLENSEQTSPAHVSSQLSNPLNSSAISINLSSDPIDISGEVQALTISGSISPAYQNETVTVYLSQDGISYDAYTTKTDNCGNYSFNWNMNATGTYYIRTSWSGNTDCAGADSETLTIFLGFPKSLIQFKGPGYYYTYGRPYVGRNVLRARQGVEDFLDVQLSGTGVLLTGEFIIVKSGQLITIPREGETRESIEEIVIPKGFQPLKLPDDIEQTTNSQFSVILRNSGGSNYSLNVKGLDDYDTAKINLPSENGTAFMNTTGCITENTWYKVVARISDDEITAELHDTDGTLIESIANKNSAVNVNELVIVLTNNTDRAVAFKNLNIETLSQTTQPIEGNKKTATENELLIPNVAVAVLLATVLAAGVYIKKRKQM